MTHLFGTKRSLVQIQSPRLLSPKMGRAFTTGRQTFSLVRWGERAAGNFFLLVRQPHNAYNRYRQSIARE